MTLTNTTLFALVNTLNAIVHIVKAQCQNFSIVSLNFALLFLITLAKPGCIALRL